MTNKLIRNTYQCGISLDHGLGDGDLPTDSVLLMTTLKWIMWRGDKFLKKSDGGEVATDRDGAS